MDVLALDSANGQAVNLIEPGQSPLHHPPVAVESLSGIGALTGDADRDAPGAILTPDAHLAKPLATAFAA